MSNVTDQIISFIQSIGINISFRTVGDDSFLPGISIEQGNLIIDVEQLKHPGDLLHEAGHIAVVPAADRPGLNAEAIADRRDRGAEEMMAIAWSYAAAVHLSIDPYIVFHEEGYKGGSESIANAFMHGNGFGVPMLEYTGMAYQRKKDEGSGFPAFPEMITWMRN